MNGRTKLFAAIGTVLVLIAIAIIWHYTHLPQSPLDGSNTNRTSTQNVGNFDQFQKDLADRVLLQYGGGKDFSVVVATTAYPLGTLLRSTGSVPADLDDCAPSPIPQPFQAQHLFPSYTMSSDTAISANIGSGAIQGLDSAGVALKQSQSIQYTIADTQLLIMDDKSVENVTGQGSCGKYISSHPGTRMIRGTVMGKMTFTVKVDNPASVRAQLAKLGGFSIDDNPGSSTVSIADNERQPIVQLLSEFNSQSPIDTAPTPKPVQAIRLEPAPPSNTDRSPASVNTGTPQSIGTPQTHMYVQMDVLDSADSGTKVVQSLRSAWPSADVESKVQKIPTQKMPDVAQVRYFNESDLAIATRCVQILQKSYPTARAVRIGLPSPKGQLEVWLPKANAGTIGNKAK